MDHRINVYRLKIEIKHAFDQEHILIISPMVRKSELCAKNMWNDAHRQCIISNVEWHWCLSRAKPISICFALSALEQSTVAKKKNLE